MYFHAEVSAIGLSRYYHHRGKSVYFIQVNNDSRGGRKKDTTQERIHIGINHVSDSSSEEE
jgi:hypothetical protein